MDQMMRNLAVGEVVKDLRSAAKRVRRVWSMVLSGDGGGPMVR